MTLNIKTFIVVFFNVVVSGMPSAIMLNVVVPTNTKLSTNSQTVVLNCPNLKDCNNLFLESKGACTIKQLMVSLARVDSIRMLQCVDGAR